MADRLPPETIELVLSLGFDSPGAEDVDIEKERSRRALLWSASLVCRRWTPLASAALPRSIVIRNAAELAAHERVEHNNGSAFEQSLCLSLACFPSTVLQQDRLRRFARCMPRLQYLRLACATMLYDCSLPWSGRHMVVDELECGHDVHEDRHWPDLWLFRALDASSACVGLSLLTPGHEGCMRLGSAFAARVETLRLGDRTRPFWFSDGEMVPHGALHAHMARLRSISMYADTLTIATGAIVGRGEAIASIADYPMLHTVRVGLGPDWPSELADIECAAAERLLQRLPRSCLRLTVELTSGRGGAEALIGLLVQAMADSTGVGVKALVVDVRWCELDEAWRSSDAVAALERACAARGVAVEVRI